MSTSVAVGEDFPLVCETCLGSNPYVRMEKIPNGVECRISKRPCTGFEWRVNGVKKQTCVAYPIAAQKNICQVCMNDLTFGLPVSVRDSFLKKAMEKGVEGVNEMFGSLPKSRVGMDYMFNQQLAQQASAEAGVLQLTDESSEAVSSLVTATTAHVQDSSGFKFRLPDICQDWVSGEAHKRSCSKRPCCGLYKFPELPSKIADQLENQLKNMGPGNVKLDEASRRILSKVASRETKAGSSGAPNAMNSTLFVANLPATIKEDQVRAVFSKFPGLTRVNVVDSKSSPGKVAFVEYSSKQEASFVLSLSGMAVAGHPVQLSWARPSESESNKPPRGEDLSSRSERRPHQQRDSERHSERKRIATAEASSAPRRQQEAETPQHPNGEHERKKVKSEDAGTKPSLVPTPQALENALKIRKAKNLDDD